MEMLDHDFEIELTLLQEAIFLKYKYDFRDYSRESVRRQMDLALNEFGCRTLSALQDKILRDPNSFAKLLSFFSISFSEMFRDPTYFRSIREKVIPELRKHPLLKIWIAGCCTGEEVYSFAILLKEEGLLDRTIIYATDINALSLQKAKAGVFPLEDLQKFTINYQKSGGKAEFSDYYTAGFGAAIFHKDLKKNMIFCDHNLATDTVFSETHLVSCRNVFIYFERILQDRALGLFHESLCTNGFLGLGPVESVEYSKYADNFKLLVSADSIYSKGQ